MLKQGLQQKLLQKLSPQQIQFIKLLQLNTTDLEQRVEQELIENPALENSKEDEYSSDISEDVKVNTAEDETPAAEAEREEELPDVMDDEVFDISEYTSNDDYDNDSFQMSDDGEDEDRKEMPIAGGSTFYDSLIEQYTAISNSDHETALGKQIIGTLDEDGYLRRPLEAIINDLLFTANTETTVDELEKVLHKVQGLDPAGIAARTLQECLLLQLHRKDHHHPEVKIAQEIIEHHFEDFTKKHYEKLMRQLKLTDEQLKEAITLITHLNPKPGETDTDSKIQYVIPDFILVENNGKLGVVLNSRNAPDLRISRSYMDTMKSYEKNPKGNKHLKDTVQFIKQKLDSAKWFIDSIKQRQNTLLMTMNAILHYQYDYFTDGDETKLRPMILKDIADKVGMDVSTISRVANSKYVQTDFGVIPLKFFFSEGIQTDEGEEVSSREVKRILQDAIGSEDKKKPLPDEKLMEILKEKGYNIARRTVAKYREQLNIPVARLRKEM
ncbi:MAG: RNA polymerase factor sigma-54 [Bacteroidia bacterium]|nr:RNA polymerase factor sigma-54 [Bacteroidia bacterium]